MSLRQRLFGQSGPDEPEATPSAAEDQAMAADPGPERAVTWRGKNGEPYEVGLERFRAELLPSAIARAWNDADALTAAITWGLKEECADLLSDAARRLRDISGARSSVCLEAFVLIENGRAPDAERSLRLWMDHFGPEVDILATLADACWMQGDRDGARRALDHALELHPDDEGAQWRLEEYFGRAA
jgi:hypothetical protein